MFWLKFAVFLIITFVVIRPAYAAYLYTRPLRLRIRFYKPDALDTPYEEVSILSQDGTSLAGWYVQSRNGAAVLLLHGHSGNRLAVLKQAESLVAAGFGVLMLDLRAHGHSEGQRFIESERLIEDVLAAVAYLRRRPEVSPAGIGVYGVSVGGMLALHAAAQTVAVRAVMADGPSAATAADLPAAANVWERFFSWPLQRYYLRARAWFMRHEPPLPPNRDVIGQLAPRPLLLVATGRKLEQRMVQQLHDAATAPKDLWLIPEARHASGWSSRPRAYAERLISFFRWSLLTDRTDPPPWEAGAAAETAVALAHMDPSGRYPIAYDATISFLLANLVALLLLPLSYLLLFLPYRLLWGTGVLERQLTFTVTDGVWVLLAFAAGIVIHEGLHAVGAIWIGKVARTAVHFGFSWKGMAPYAHCREPLSANAYRAMAALPGLVLGVLPGLLGIAFQQWWLVVWGALMLVAAGGDLAILLAIRRVPGDARVLDHPTKAGCLVIRDE